MSAACQIPIVTKAMEMPMELRFGAVQGAAELSWANNTLLLVLGQDAEGRMVLCDDDCGEGRDGAITVCSEVEAMSRGYSLEPGRTCTPISRAGRTAYAWPTSRPR